MIATTTRVLRAALTSLGLVAVASSLASCAHDASEEPEPYLPTPTPFSPTPPKPQTKKPVEERPPRIPNPADGKCERAVVSSGIVDPDCVYLFGTVVDDGGGPLGQALIDPFRPNDRAFGFALPRRIIVHPKTGELWFHADDPRSPPAIYVHEENIPEGMLLTSQRRIAIPSCPGHFTDPWDFGLFADDGALAITCTDGRTLVPPKSEPFDDRFWEYLEWSHDRAALVVRGPATYAVLKDGNAAILDWSEQRFIAARSRAGGGFLVATGGTFPDYFPQLYDLEIDGTVSTRGSYDFGVDPWFDGAGRCKVDASGGISCNSAGTRCALEASGALQCLTVIGEFSEGKMPLDILVRYTRDAPPRILYDAHDSNLKISSVSLLVTGP